jgi:hypothetical protein
VRALPQHWRRFREAWVFLNGFYHWPQVRRRAWDLYAASEAAADERVAWFERGLLWCSSALLCWLLLPPVMVLWAGWLTFTLAAVLLVSLGGCGCPSEGLGGDVQSELGRFLTAALEFPDDAEVGLGYRLQSSFIPWRNDGCFVAVLALSCRALGSGGLSAML